MSFLAGAHNALVSHSHFTSVGHDQHHTTIHTQNITFSAAEKESILSSLMPADRRGHYVPPCMEGTRNTIFENIDDWLLDFNAPNILWLRGSPGVGKSTIASSLMSRLGAKRQLGASFFFQRGVAALSNPSNVWRTVAFDLAKSDPSIAKRLMLNLKEGRVDPGRPDIELHFKYLVEEPLKHKEATAMLVDDRGSGWGFGPVSGQEKNIEAGPSPHVEQQLASADNSPRLHPVVILDALDECGSDRSQSTQRRIFLKTLTDWSRLPSFFKLIVTSRDDGIPQSFRDVCYRLSLDTGDLVSTDANRDVEIFFRNRFAEIAVLYPSLLAWPAPSIIMELTSRAAGLFIWADTVVRFVEQGVASEQLDLLLASGFREGGNRVDALYAQILDLSFKDCKADIYERFAAVVGAVVLAKAPLRRSDLKLFVGTRGNEPSIDFILQKLSSVISTGDKDDIVRVCHLTFTEFVCSSERFGEPFVVSRSLQSEFMALTCLRILNAELKFNICALETSYLRNDEVEDLSSRIEKMIPVFLLYSCRFFAEHLEDITEEKYDAALVKEMEKFLQYQFLFWLEVMSLRKWISVAVKALHTTTRWLKIYSKELSAFAADAQKFIVDCEVPISTSVPHIYLSALPFVARESRVSRHYQPRFSGTVFIPESEQRWSSLTDMFAGRSSYAWSRSFTPDVSGFGDGMICTWDADTGKVMSGALNEQTKWIWAAAFSPNGRGVVSISGRHMVSILDGNVKPLAPSALSGPAVSVTAVAFSPIGRRVASCAGDRTIHIWHADTNQIVSSPPRLHRNRITSLAFSPDAKRIVSGSWDTSIYIWNADTGKVLYGPLKGHVKGVNSVAFAPDGRRVVSGSDDQTLRIWTPETEKGVSDPFKGHTDQVTSVAFSPDGTRVVSGADDRLIRIWNTETGQTVCDPLTGHTERITSTAFSPSGRHIVSGSIDRTIRVWDANTGKCLLGPLRGHTGAIFSVAFSPDEKRLISAGVDQTVRVWHAHPVESVSLHLSDEWMLHIPDDRTDEGLLFWVPPEYRKGICGKETISIMGVPLAKADFSRFVHGRSWQRCHTPQPVNHSKPSSPATAVLPFVRPRSWRTGIVFILLFGSIIIYLSS